MLEGADMNMMLTVVSFVALIFAYHVWRGFFDDLVARTRCIRMAILVMYEARGEMTRTDARNTFFELLPCPICQASFDGCWSSLVAWGFLHEYASGLYVLTPTGKIQLDSELDTKKFCSHEELAGFERDFDHRGSFNHTDLIRDRWTKSSVEKP